ncbi:MAG: SpoIIE family protein phosphatase [Acidobacteria bacterium]|nr:SpoIIE family protein phosphatase [Acidobacteriota bacterium]
MNARRVFLLVLLVLTVGFRFRAAYETFLNPAPAYLDFYGIDAKVRGQNLTVVKEDKTDTSSPGYRAGVRAGDKVLAIGKTPSAYRQVLSMIDYIVAMQASAPGGSFWLRISREGREQDVHVAFTDQDLHRFDLHHTSLMLLALILIPLIAAGTGFFIGFSKTDDPNAFMAGLMFIGFSTISEGGMAIYLFPTGLREVGILYQFLMNGLLPYFYMRFFLRFPSPSIIEEKVPWLKNVLLILLFPLVGAGAWHTWLQTQSFARAEMMTRPGEAIELFAQILVSLIFTIGSLSLGLNTGRARTRDEKRRMNILLGGTMASMLPLLGVVIYTYLSGGSLPAWAILAILLLLLIFPLSFVYAILRHRVLGLKLIIRRGLQYLLVSRGFLAVEGFFLFLFFYWLAESVFRPFIEQAGQGVTAGATAVLALVAATGLKQVNRQVMPVIDRRFFREAYDAQRILSELGQAVRRLGRRTDQLLQMITDRISDSLQPDHVAVFLRPSDLPALPAPRERAVVIDEEGTDRGGLAGRGGRFCCYRHRLRTGHRDDPVYSHTRYDALCLDGGAVSLRKLWEGSAEEPKALEVYLDDPRSWTREILERAGHDPGVAAEMSFLEALNVRLLIPLYAGERPAGFIALGERLSEEPYSRDDVDLLLMVAQQTSIALEYARLVRQETEQIKLQREMEIAKEVQGCLFPQRQPVLRTLEYAGICRAARGVGGDYYDFVSLDEQTLGIALGDVSGKGISAALLMANLQATLRSHASLHRDRTDRVVTDVNRLMTQATGCGKYATFFYAVYDDRKRSLTYTNAGHNPPMVFRAAGRPALCAPADPGPGMTPDRAGLGSALVPVDPGHPEHLETGGVPVGLFAEWEYPSAAVTLEPGDVFVIFTDGVTEALDSRGEEFGEDRLAAVVSAHLNFGAAAIAEKVLAEVNAFAGDAEQHDDITLVVGRAV